MPNGILYIITGGEWNLEKVTLLIDGQPTRTVLLEGQNKRIVQAGVKPVNGKVDATLSLLLKDSRLERFILHAPTLITGEIQAPVFMFFTKKTLRSLTFSLKGSTGQTVMLSNEKNPKQVILKGSSVTVYLSPQDKQLILGTGVDYDIAMHMNYAEGGFDDFLFSLKVDFSPVVKGPELEVGTGQPTVPTIIINPETGEIISVDEGGAPPSEKPQDARCAVKGSVFTPLLGTCGCIDPKTRELQDFRQNPDGSGECVTKNPVVQAAERLMPAPVNEATVPAVSKPIEKSVDVPESRLSEREPRTIAFVMQLYAKPVVFKGQQQKILVKTSDGMPIDSAELQVTLPDGTVRTLYSDNSGTADFMVDNIGKYSVVAKKGEVEVRLDFQSYETITEVPVISPTMPELYLSAVEEFSWISVVVLVLLAAVAGLTFYTYANITFPDYGLERNNLARGAVYFFTFLFLATPLIMGYFYRLGTGLLLALAETLIAYAFFNYVEPMLQLGKQEKPAE